MRYLFSRISAPWRRTSTTLRLRGYSTNLPANVDLLERYRGLVALGRIEEDEEQIRVIMQVRPRLRRIDVITPWPCLTLRSLDDFTER